MATTQPDADAKLGDIFDLTFTKFVTPLVIKVMYILVMAFLAVFWLFIIIAGFASSVGNGIAAILLGGLFALIYLLFYRVFAEVIMIVFRMKETLDVIAINTGQSGVSGGGGSTEA